VLAAAVPIWEATHAEVEAKLGGNANDLRGELLALS
jgi:hypothetical protein